MAFFDKLGQTISKGSADVAKKTRDFAEIGSLNSQISSQEDIIRNTYVEIGRLYFEAHKAEPDAVYTEQIGKILDAMAVIEEKRQRIRTIKGIRICTQCGAEIPLEAAFCAKCGNKVEVEAVQGEVVAPEEEPAVVHCPECNAELPADVAFCTSCGHRMHE